MSLSKRLSAAPRTSRGVPGCRMGWIVEQLSDDDAAALSAALFAAMGDPDRLSSAVITEALQAEGYTVHSKTVENHRKGVCRCESGRTPST